MSHSDDLEKAIEIYKSAPWDTANLGDTVDTLIRYAREGAAVMDTEGQSNGIGSDCEGNWTYFVNSFAGTGNYYFGSSPREAIYKAKEVEHAKQP